MKRLFSPAWMSAWLAGLLPRSLFNVGRKTPWYRRSWMTYAPWISVALITPFAVFLIWVVARKMVTQPENAE